jgi:hypothetical protein
MPIATCAAHPAAAAAFRCDGCGRLLCADCVEQGHRLIFCRHCRERALPLDPGLQATTPALRRALARARPTRFADALLYPLRGQGGLLFWVYLALMVVTAVAASMPGSWALLLTIQVVLGLIMPGLLYAIVRRTAEGDDELPDWPDASEVGERLFEVITFYGTAIVACAPAILALLLAGCGLLPVTAPPTAAHCLWALAAGLLVGLPVAVPMFGSLAVYQHVDLIFRLDLHLRALIAGGTDSGRTVLLTYALLAASRAISWALHGLPLVGGVLAAGIAAYGSFTAAHLVGLLFRKHAAALDAIYLP